MTEEIKTRGICLRTVEYGESDRIITLLTDNKGKIAVRARGVSSAKSKLRLAATPFAFGEYILTIKSGFYTLKTFDYADSFQTISDDIFRYYAGAAALETTDKLNEEEVPDVHCFTCLLRFLSRVCYEGGGEGDFVPFVLDMLKLSGYGASLGNYRASTDYSYYYFDLEEGGFVPSEKKGASSVKLTREAAALFAAYIGGERPQNPSRFSLAEILALLSMYIRVKTGKTVRSFFELASLLRGESPV